VLRSDEIRKELAGLRSRHRGPSALWRGHLLPAATATVYATLLSRAVAALRHDETVILDASWTDDQWRTLGRAVACGAQADLVELRCDSPPAVAAARLEQRAAARADPSDATPEVAERMALVTAPWPTATTTDAPDAALAAALRFVRE